MLDLEQVRRDHLHGPVASIPPTKRFQLLLELTKLDAMGLNGYPERGQTRVLRSPVGPDPAGCGAEFRA